MTVNISDQREVRLPPIWRRSHPADEVLSPAQNGVIGVATTRTHAE
jgi:hypothetical protein